jgi:CubicO group peptidase (beta-lactamase class C family)
MPGGAAVSTGGLGELTFVNPQDGPSGLGRHHGHVPATEPAPLPTVLRDLDVEIAGAGRLFDLASFRSYTHTTSLLVVVDGTVVHEWYADGLGPTDLFLGASMTKSVLAGLVGLAVDSGALDLDTPVLSHVPELAGSGYAGVTVRQVASMTSGVDWIEDHRDPTSLASRLVQAFTAGEGRSRELLGAVSPGVAPGSRYAYCTADSQVLDWVRERATGLDYVTALGALWRTLGCTVDAVVSLDGPAAPAGTPGHEPTVGVPMAGGGLAAASRDWARFGMLQATGSFSGRQLLSPAWVEASCVPATPFCRPGRLPSTITTHAGFGLHWWPLDDAGLHVTADGSRGQFTYVDRTTGVVVVKTSRWPYDEPTDRQCRDLSYLGLPAIARVAADS